MEPVAHVARGEATPRVVGFLSRKKRLFWVSLVLLFRLKTQKRTLCDACSHGKSRGKAPARRAANARAFLISEQATPRAVGFLPLLFYVLSTITTIANAIARWFSV
jgi:hypothetical protein